jgi:predicted NAD/FAD-dependent oxidoreductase
MMMICDSNRRIAIIGGGISGLSCAKRLVDLGNNNVVVFDTGKNSVGGRCSSRNTNGIVFDHSSQYMTIDTNSDFKRELKQYIDQNLIKQWNGKIVKLNSNNEIEPMIDKDNTHRYVGSNGMMGVSQALSTGLTIRRPVWVSKLHKQQNNKWKLMQFNEDLGEFDVVVIAHNGKCADRLISTTPNSLIHSRLKVLFGPVLPKPDRMTKMQLCSLFVGTFAVKKGVIVGMPGDAIIVNNSLPLSWICCTSKKIGQQHNEYESYTVISTREFAAANKVPQESIPKDKEIEVKNVLLRAFESALGLESQSIVPILYNIQLWGAGVPLNVYSSPFVMDSRSNIAICGDWMASSEHTTGPNIETAFMSGFKLANELIKTELTDVGLGATDCYQALQTHPIGDIVPSTTISNTIIRGPPLNSIVNSQTSNNNTNSNNNNRNRNNNNNRNRNNDNNRNRNKNSDIKSKVP